MNIYYVNAGSLTLANSRKPFRETTSHILCMKPFRETKSKVTIVYAQSGEYRAIVESRYSYSRDLKDRGN